MTVTKSFSLLSAFQVTGILMVVWTDGSVFDEAELNE